MDSGAFEERCARAMERIIADPGLTNALTDGEARPLIAWAEERVRWLVRQTEGLDEEAAWAQLEPRLSILRRYVRRIAAESAGAPDPEAAVHATLGAHTAELRAYFEEHTDDHITHSRE